MPVKNPIDCFKKYGVKDLSNQLQKRIEEGANPYEAAREIILAEHRRLHDTVNDIRTVGKLKKEPYIEPKDISQQLKKLKEKPSVSVQMPGEVKKPEIVQPTTKVQETLTPTDKVGEQPKSEGDNGVLDNLNPSGSIFSEYTPEQRDMLPLGENIVTYDKTSGKNPDELITVYRGVPKDINEIKSGDFVTTNEQLAKDYAGSGKVISKQVRADEILDDITEPLGEEYILRKKPKDVTPKIAETTTPTAPQAEAAETMQQEAGEPSGEKLTAEPPPGEPPPTSSGGIYVERPATELSFRGLQDVANEFGYEDVKSRDRVSDVQERQNAINTSKKWAEKGEYEKNVNNLLSEIEKRERVPTAEQRIILEMYLANEKQKLRDIADKSSPEFDSQLQKVKRIKEVGNIARSEAGAALRVNEGRSLPHPINDYADAMTAMAEANSVEVLTDAQKAEVEKLVTTYEQRSKEAEAKVLAMEQRMMEIEAAKEVGQIRQYKKAAKKRTAEQLKQERENILNSLKEKWANAGKDVLSSDIPFRKQIAAIAPDVKKLVANLLDSGVNELSQIIDNIHAAISGFIPDVGKDDIRDIIGGKYNRKQKRSELAKKVADLKTEVNLIDRLQDLLKGEEPKTEKRKIERNQKIQELRRQIKDLSGFESELAKAADELISQKQKEAKKLDKDLSKIEKEEDAAEERAKKEEEAAEERAKKEEEAKLERERKEAERERVRLEKEFEKEKNREEKEKLKAAVQDAKRAEKMLSYKLPGERKLEEFKNRAQKAEQDIRAKIEAGDFEKEDKPTSVFDSKDLKEAFPIQYREMLDAIAAKEDAQRDYDIAVYKAEQAKRGKVRKVIDWGRAVIATTKALKSGIDDSAVMMQNVVAMVSHPRSAVKALREHALDAVSEKRFRRSLTEIHNSPLWDLIEKSGLDITDPQSLKEQNKEEVFDKNLLNKDFKIGGKKFNIGKYVTRPFERAFTSLGNAMRVNMFARITEKWADEGKTFETNPEDYKALATLLNTETGRGKLHTQIERASQLITAGIWSPRLMSSRLNMLGVSDVLLPLVGGKGYYAGLSPKIRQMAIADMVKFIGAGISLMAFAAFRGADVDDDPESPTFGTIKIGDKKYNTWGGFTPYVKTFVQGATGKRNIRGERKDVARSKILFSFFRSRLTPAAGVTTNLLTGRDFANRPITAEGEIMNLMAPLSVMGIIDGLKKDGIVGLLNQGLPSFVGVGVSDERDFEPENKNQERKQNKPKGKERKD